LFFHRVQRVQRGHGLLKNHADAAAAQGAQLGLAGAGDFPAVEADAAAGMARGGRQKLQYGQRGDAFAAAGLADQGDCFAAPQRQ